MRPLASTLRSSTTKRLAAALVVACACALPSVLSAGSIYISTERIAGTGSDENPISVGGTITNPLFTGDNNMKRLSNQLQCVSAGDCDVFYNVSDFQDPVAIITVATVPGADNKPIYLCARATATGSVTSYCLEWNAIDQTHARMVRYAANVRTDITTFSMTVGAGDWIAFAVIGDETDHGGAVATFKSTDAGTTWSNINTNYDATITAAGKCGFGMRDTTTRVTSFKCGSWPFPQVAVQRDNFTRADENPLSFCSRWSTATNFYNAASTPMHNLKVLSNKLANTAAGGGAQYWQAGQINLDGAEAYVTPSTLDTNNFKPLWIDAYLDPATLGMSTLKGYGLGYNDEVGGTNNDTWRPYYYATDSDFGLQAGTLSNNGKFRFAISAGDSIGMSAFYLSADSFYYFIYWYKPAAGSWRAKAFRFDNTYSGLTSGYMATGMSDTTWRDSEWGSNAAAGTCGSSGQPIGSLGLTGVGR